VSPPDSGLDGVDTGGELTEIRGASVSHQGTRSPCAVPILRHWPTLGDSGNGTGDEVHLGEPSRWRGWAGTPHLVREQQVMADKVLKIDTIFGIARFFDYRDGLLLTEMTGQEGISIPYYYDLQMVAGDTWSDLKPEKLIGTMVRIGVKQTWYHRVKHGDGDYMHRTGMVQHVERTGRYNPGGVGPNQMFTFKARVVPTFMMLGREVRYRVFEDLSAYDIIVSILKDMQARCPEGFRYNVDKLKQADFEKMDYSVQYGESTYAFLSRLMNQAGIWYSFDHDDNNAKDLPKLMQADNATMFLGRYPNVPTTAVDYNPQSITDDDPDKNSVANFQRQYEVKFDRIWAGNFNILDPTKPPMARTTLPADFDLLNQHASVDGYSISEEFPASFDDVAGATEYVGIEDKDAEAVVYTISGGTKNTSFVAGRWITIKTDHDHYNDEQNDGDYLLSMVFINAYEHSYMTTTAQDISNFFFRDFLFSPFQTLKGVGDFTVAVTNAGLNNWLQNQQAQAFNELIHGSTYANSSNNVINHDFGSFFLGGITQVGITSAISAIVSSAYKLAAAQDGKYSNTFVAIPGNKGTVCHVPIATAPPRVVVHGPHSAVVIGPDGTDTAKLEVYADPLGRVRIRFPWDPGPPRNNKGGGLPTPWTDAGSDSTYPFSRGTNTCWVRVSEAWAGRHYGSQYMPRIGQEVLVSFIDGDPENPIITGRVYNADSGTSNLPLVPQPLDKTQLKTLSDLSGKTSKDWRFSGVKTQSLRTVRSGQKTTGGS